MNTAQSSGWKLVGGNLCIDFINSVGGRMTPNEEKPDEYEILKDKFENYGDLVEWAKAAGVINKFLANNLKIFFSQNQKEGDKIFERAIRARESYYRIFKSLIYGFAPRREDIDLLNSECAQAREEQKLFFQEEKFSWNFEPKVLHPESIIWHVSLAAAKLLTSNQLDRVKECPGENCGWLFLDTSRNGSRQWCDMKDCGNLAKVRRFREKKK